MPLLSLLVGQGEQWPCLQPRSAADVNVRRFSTEPGGESKDARDKDTRDGEVVGRLCRGRLFLWQLFFVAQQEKLLATLVAEALLFKRAIAKSLDSRLRGNDEQQQRQQQRQRQRQMDAAVRRDAVRVPK